MSKCLNCNGTGKVTESNNFSPTSIRYECPACHGTGKYDSTEDKEEITKTLNTLYSAKQSLSDYIEITIANNFLNVNIWNLNKDQSKKLKKCISNFLKKLNKDVDSDLNKQIKNTEEKLLSLLK